MQGAEKWTLTDKETLFLLANFHVAEVIMKAVLRDKISLILSRDELYMLQYWVGRQITHIGAIVTRLFMGLTTTLLLYLRAVPPPKVFIASTANVVKPHEKRSHNSK